LGETLPNGAVTNPIMNPVMAAMYTPYLANYNNMVTNPGHFYYHNIPSIIIHYFLFFKVNVNSSLAGFPQKTFNQEDPYNSNSLQ